MDLAAVARRQGGVFTRAQARTAGYSDHQIDRRLASGRWQRWFATVPCAALVEAATPRTRRGELWAGVLAAGPGVAISLATAAWLWGWCADRRLVQLSIPPGRRPRLPPPVQLHRVALPDDDVTVLDGLPVTSRLRTLADCLRLLPRPDASEVLDRSQQRSGPPLASVALALPVGGRGCAQARALLAAADGTVFAAERLLARLLRQARITGWVANHPVVADGRRFVLDVAFPGLRIAIEVDGFAHHHDVERFQRDRRRQNLLIADGWLVLRFTWADLTERPADVVAQVRAAIALRVDV